MAGNQNLPTENINQVILGLLKIKSGTEIDYQTYFNIIKKRLAAHRMVGAAIPAEEDQLLREEFKRVGRLKDKGRFKVKIKTIKVSGASGVAPSKAPDSVRQTTSPTKSSAIVKAAPVKISKDFIQPQIQPDITEKTTKVNRDSPLYRINKTLDSILKTLTNTGKEEAKEKERQRRESENKKREEREKGLESKSFEGIKKALSAITKPFQSIWDRIFNFIFYTLLGRAVMKLIDWFADPKNKEKIQSLIRFLVDFGPALLAGYVLFGTKFGKALRVLSSIAIKGIVNLTRFAIPKLLTFIRSNPLAAGLALFTAGAVVPKMFPGTVNEQERKIKEAPGTKEEKIKALQDQKSKLNFFEKLQGKGSEIDEQIYALQTGKTKAYGFSGGGFSGLKNRLSNLGKGPTFFDGVVSGPKGRDKVPAMLTDGEFVMSVGAVNKYGVDTLEAMNAAGGGTNQPTITNGVTHAFGGGPVGNIGSYTQDPMYQLDRFLDNLMGRNVDINNPTTWPPKGVMSGIYKQGMGLGNQIYNQGKGLVNQGLNQAVKAQSYLQKGGLEKDVSKLTQVGTQFGAGLYDQALKVGNQALSDIQSGRLQNQVVRTATQTGQRIAEAPKKTAGGFFDFMSGMSTSKKYREGSARVEKAQNQMISFGDKFIKKLPEGPFREIADKGLIPIPSGNATTMRNLTFAKALLGPLGRPFKILSNKEVDEMRQKTIEKTMNKSGLMVDPRTGQVKMNWNQEDINKGARGGGAYTNDLGKRGGSFNFILGRFSASTEGKGNTLYSDDRYNFNKTVAEYAKLAKEGLMKGSMSDATYFGASMLGRFAQDIGWLNQRALGSRIEIGKVNRSTLDPSTGKPKTSAQIKAEQSKMKQQAAIAAKKRINIEKLEAKRPWWDKMGLFGGGSRVAKEEKKKNQDFLKKNPGAKLYNKPKPNSGTPYKSRFARPKSVGAAPPKPKPKSNVTVVKSSQYRGGQRGSGANPSQRAPSPSPRHRAGTSTVERTTGTKRK